MVDLGISKKDRLENVIDKMSSVPFGRTNCSLPMLDAARNNIDVDAFLIYTDNETWYGSIHPCQALSQYRSKTGINAKRVVVGMTSTGFSIADPNDPRTLDVVGFDSATPNVISWFLKED